MSPYAPCARAISISFSLLSRSLNYWFANPVDQQVTLFVQGKLPGETVSWSALKSRFQ